MDGSHNKGGTSMKEFAETHGYFPATVEDAEKRRDGWTLITIDDDPDSDILTYFDDTPAIRRGELKEQQAE